MVDRATPNLPSSGFDDTEGFYEPLGFARRFRDEGWLIMERGSLTLEFFPMPEIDPLTTSFGCCLRLDDLDSLYATAVSAGVPEARVGQPRLHPPTVESSGLRIAYLIDPEGTLLRLVQN